MRRGPTEEDGASAPTMGGSPETSPEIKAILDEVMPEFRELASDAKASEELRNNPEYARAVHNSIRRKIRVRGGTHWLNQLGGRPGKKGLPKDQVDKAVEDALLEIFGTVGMEVPE